MKGRYKYKDDNEKFKVYLDNMLNEKNFSKQQLKIINEYKDYKELKIRISPVSMFNQAFCLKLLCEDFKKDFNNINPKDINIFLRKLSNRGPVTQIHYRKLIKSFFLWYFNRLNKDIPHFIKDIDTNLRLKEKRTVKDNVTPEEVKKLINVCDHTRDKAMISVLYESALRVGEMCHLRIKDVKFDKYGALLEVPDGKEGARPFPIRLINSVPYLTEWINSHPNKDDPESPLWISRSKGFYGKPLDKYGFYHLLKNMGKRAKIKKRIYNHLFRGSRLSELGASGYTESQIQMIAGWTSTRMAKVYVRPDFKALENKMLKEAGIITTEDDTKDKIKKEALKPIKCPRCKFENPATNKYCSKCSMVLNLKEAIKLDKEKTNLQKELTTIRQKITKVDSVMGKLISNKKVLKVLSDEASK